ncbi:MAG: ABC transporter permease [Thermaerobacter sp.]|nr:peptide ABC transporter permease [Bacillota bacterium]REJ32601.1 MAG: peptide ABC transporter permease [Bacillota bacterium]
MRAFIIRRLFLSAVAVLGVAVITFVVARLVPADPAARWVGPHATAEQIARARVELGLDQPLWRQLITHMAALAVGDWGRSIITHQPVIRDIAAHLPTSLVLVAAGTLLAVALGIPLGVVSAAARNRWPDHLSRALAIGLVSIPTFWLAMILQLWLGQGAGLLPIAGQVDTVLSLLSPVPRVTGALVVDSLLAGRFDVFRSALAHLVMPALTVAAYPLGLITRMVRSSMMEVLSEDYVRTARAYGVAERRILYRHALRNAMGPTLTVIALSLGYALTGTFLVEAVFAWPGLGRYAANAVIGGDFPAIVGVTVVVALAYVLLNLVVDLAQAALDPRVRYD